MSPAMYCSGVKLVVWWRWIVDMRGSCCLTRTYSTNEIKPRELKRPPGRRPRHDYRRRYHDVDHLGIMMSIIGAMRGTSAEAPRIGCAGGVGVTSCISWGGCRHC